MSRIGTYTRTVDRIRSKQRTAEELEKVRENYPNLSHMYDEELNDYLNEEDVRGYDDMLYERHKEGL